MINKEEQIVMDPIENFKPIEKFHKPRENNAIPIPPISVIESIYDEWTNDIDGLQIAKFNPDHIAMEKYNYLRPFADTEVYVHPNQTNVDTNNCIKIIQKFEDRYFIQIVAKKIVTL